MHHRLPVRMEERLAGLHRPLEGYGVHPGEQLIQRAPGLAQQVDRGRTVHPAVDALHRERDLALELLLAHRQLVRADAVGRQSRQLRPDRVDRAVDGVADGGIDRLVAGRVTGPGRARDREPHLPSPAITARDDLGVERDARRAIRREMPFLSVEAVRQLGPKTYLAGRYSGIGTASGFLLPGEGRTDDARLTERLERFSFGVGYGPRPSLSLKLEQSFNLGRRVGGTERTGENQTAAEALLRF